MHDVRHAVVGNGAIDGSDIGIGADILVRAALSDEFADAGGSYYDNDAKRFGPPHAHASDPARAAAIVASIEGVLARLSD